MIINKVHFLIDGTPFRAYRLKIGGNDVRISVSRLHGSIYGIRISEFQDETLIMTCCYTVDSLYYDAIVELLAELFAIVVSPVDFDDITSFEHDNKRNRASKKKV